MRSRNLCNPRYLKDNGTYLHKENQVFISIEKGENMRSEGYYIINVQPEEKTVKMKIAGTFSPQTAEDFHKDYMEKVASIPTEDFILIVDCTEMDAIKRDMLPRLQVSFAMYNESNFKKIQFLIRNNPEEVKSQLARVTAFSGMTNVEFVENN